MEGHTRVSDRDWRSLRLIQGCHKQYAPNSRSYVICIHRRVEKSNESHVGTITQSNLCTEIVQYTDPDETAVCTLASIILPSFVSAEHTFNFREMESVVRHALLSLNKIIHATDYPSNGAKFSAYRHRAVGIGIQGLADTFALMNMPFDSDAAKKLNIEIAETIYYAAIDESCNLTSLFGIYPSFVGSPISEGHLQFDLWEQSPSDQRYDWTSLRRKIVKGMSNSLVTAYMPTAGTTQITGFSECFEPYPR